MTDGRVSAARAINHPDLGLGLINPLLVGYYGVEPDEYDALATLKNRRDRMDRILENLFFEVE